MSEAVFEDAIEQIADGLAVDWGALDRAAPREPDWARSLRILSDIVKLHRDAAVDFEQTTLAKASAPGVGAAVEETDAWGRYRLANKVGEGSYGSVYRAWDSELERDVAIKILHRRVGDLRLKDRLLQEGRALARIRHNNVVNVLGVEAHADRVGLCMEFVQGKTLADVVRSQGRLSAAEAVLIGEDLCRALAAVHRAGYIHRDVKAKNVMRDDTGRIVLMDFGTGRTAEAQDGKSDRAGTPLYMAPEVLEGRPASASSDVYSLGVLLYHLVTADYPVRANSVDELRARHARREHQWLSEVRPDLPVAFMQVVEKAIALDPDERYANASELLAALSTLTIGPRPWVWRVMTPALWIAGALGGIFLLGLMTSIHFDVALQRSEFTTEGAWDWLVWGRRTSFPPLVILVMVLIPASLLVVLHRLLLACSAWLRAWDSRIRRELVHRLRLDEAPILAAYALLISASALVLACWYFNPLIVALLSRVATASVEDLTLLSPAHVTYHNSYRGVFSGVVILSLALWYPVLRLVRKGQSVHWGLVAGGIVVTVSSLSVLHFPYRLLYFNKAYEAVQWRDNRCYAIGERPGDLLLFCSELSPRNRIVKKEDPALQHLNITESIFSQFGRKAE